jgi:hypothetical protein
MENVHATLVAAGLGHIKVAMSMARTILGMYSLKVAA